jgi:hypothetical protein
MAKKKKSKRASPPPDKPSSSAAPTVEGAPRKASARAVLPSPFLPSWLTPVVVGACCLFVFWQMKPGLLFTSNLPTGGDAGGQIWGPAQLKDIFPALSGWTPQWFGGFPLYVLYMPVPALVVLLFNVVFTYGIAYKLAVAISALVLPVAAYGLGRLSRLPAPIPACLAVATIPFLFDDSFFKYGGNIMSSVIGEYAYGLGVPAALIALGLMDVVMRTGRWRALTVVAAAVAALMHPAIAMMLVLCGVLLIAGHTLHIGWLALRRIWPVLVLAPLIGAFWFLPFAAYRSQLNQLNFSVDGGWTSVLFPLPAWAELIIVALAIVGTVRAIRLRHPISMMLVGTAAICAVTVLVFAQGAFGGWESHQTQGWIAGRMLPFWYLSLLLLAGIGAGDLFVRLAQARWPYLTTAGPIAGLVLVVMSVGVITGTLPGSDVSTVQTANGPVTQTKWAFLPTVQRSLVPSWVNLSFSGYEGIPLWPQYHALMQTMGSVGSRYGCGRAMAEDDPEGAYGSIYEMSLLPYWTNGCIDAMKGIPEEQSVNYTFADVASRRLSWTNINTIQQGVQYPDFDVSSGIPELRELGVRYYLAYTPQAQREAAADRSLRLVARSGPWKVYAVRGVSLVQGLNRRPVVVPVGGDTGNSLVWLDAATPWFEDQTGARPAADGPSSWPRVASPSLHSDGPRLPPVGVSHVVVGPNTVSFHVDRTGIPVEVRMSYFPWWQATGAQGPWKLDPDNLVVIPTSHEVVLTASPQLVDRLGQWISVLAILATIGLAIWDRRVRRAGVAVESDID